MANYFDKSNWTVTGPNILAQQNLDAVRAHLEKIGFVAVLHWHFLGARSPTPMAFDDFEEFETYLRTHVKPGDAIDVWPFPTETTKPLASGKFPNDKGEVPIKGAY